MKAIFSVDQAIQMLPLVRRIATDIKAQYADVQDLIRRYTAEEDEARKAKLNTAVADVLDRFQRLVEELENLNVWCADYITGAVRWYGDHGAEFVYYDWDPSQETITHYYGMDEGRSKRRPLQAKAKSDVAPGDVPKEETPLK